jgi:hypothetical protein
LIGCHIPFAFYTSKPFNVGSIVGLYHGGLSYLELHCPFSIHFCLRSADFKDASKQSWPWDVSWLKKSTMFTATLTADPA